MCALFPALLLLSLPAAVSATTGRPPIPAAPARVTIIYDAFGSRAGLTRDWGFSALVEYAGHRILFDTGDNAAIFERNVRALGIDLRHLDFAVISHRHGDHIAGLSYLLRVNPHVRIYAPREGFGVFGWSLPSTFYRRDSTLDRKMRYFDGEPPETMRFGTAWPGADFHLVDSLTEIVPGIALTSTVSQKAGTLELHELSLVLRTPAGLVLVVGCSHPGIETILDAAARYGDHVHLIFGGLHLVTTPDAEIARIAMALRDERHLDGIAPGHCTGEPAFAALKSAFGDQYLYAGLGTTIPLP